MANHLFLIVRLIKNEQTLLTISDNKTSRSHSIKFLDLLFNEYQKNKKQHIKK